MKIGLKFLWLQKVETKCLFTRLKEYRLEGRICGYFLILFYIMTIIGYLKRGDGEFTMSFYKILACHVRGLLCKKNNCPFPPFQIKGIADGYRTGRH